MMLLQILAFGLHFQTYHLVSHATSIQDLEAKLIQISISQTYSHLCEKEWHVQQFPTHCIKLIETAIPFNNQSPTTVRTFVNNYCKKPMNWRQTSTQDLTDMQPYMANYSECHQQLKEQLLDRQYKMQKSFSL